MSTKTASPWEKYPLSPLKFAQLSSIKSLLNSGYQDRVQAWLSTLPRTLQENTVAQIRRHLNPLASPASFAEYDSQGRWKLAKHLQKLDEKLVAMQNGKLTRLICTMPPRHGKSELLGRYTPPQWLGKFPNHRVIYISCEDRQARKYGRHARNAFGRTTTLLTNEDLAGDSSAANEWNIEAREGGMETAGVSGQVTGKGANLLLLDDLIKNAEQAASEVYREKIWDLFHSTLMSRLEPGGCVVLNMTRWHTDDIIGRVLASDTADLWEIINFPAIAENDDPLGREVGEALWPERWPLLDCVGDNGEKIEGLDTLRKTKPKYWWLGLYQQRPTKHTSVEWDESYFNWPGFWFSQWPAKDILCRVTALDPSKGKNAKAGDYSAFVNLLQTIDGQLWVEADLDRRPPGKIVSDGVELLKRFKPEAFAVEGNAWQDLLGGMFLAAIGKSLGAMAIWTLNNAINKEIRIRRLDPYLTNRTIHFRDTPGTRMLVHQLSEFPMAAHDDGPDALEMSIRLLLSVLSAENNMVNEGYTAARA